MPRQILPRLTANATLVTMRPWLTCLWPTLSRNCWRPANCGGSAPVDPELELAEIVARVAAAGGTALLFDKVAGYDFPLVANLLGSEARLSRALGAASLGVWSDRVAQSVRPGGAVSWLDRLRGADEGPSAERFRPKAAKHAASQQAVRLGRDIDLAMLPAVQRLAGRVGPLADRTLIGRRGGRCQPDIDSASPLRGARSQTSGHR